MRSPRILSFLFIVVFPGLALGQALRLQESRLLTESSPVSPSARQSFPRVAATDAGWCAAWGDYRQGGAILAARIDRDGTLLDPAGIPLERRKSVMPIEAVGTDGGCLVFHYSSIYGSPKASFVPDDPNAAVQHAFSLPPSTSFLAANRDRVLAQQREGAFGTLKLLDHRGNLLKERWGPLAFTDVVPAQHGFVGLVVRGTATQTDPTNEHSLWWIDEELRATQIGSTIRLAGRPWLASSGKEILIVSERAVEGKTVVSSFSWEGILLARFDIEPPAESRMLGVTFDGTYAIQWESGDDLWTARTDRLRVLESGSMDGVVASASAGNGSDRLTVRALASGAIEYLADDRLPAGLGTPVSRYPLNEVLIDVDRDGEMIALLWTETDLLERTERLLVGISRLDDLDFREPRVIAELDLTFERTQAAVAIDSGVATIVWNGGDTIFARRLAENGEWIDPAPVRIQAATAESHFTLTPHGLDAANGATALVYSETTRRPDTPYQSDMRILGATAMAGAELGLVRELEIAPFQAAHSPAIVNATFGWAVAWLGSPFPCQITCPPPSHPVQLAMYDRDLRLAGHLTGAEPPVSHPPPVLASEGDLVFLGAEWFPRIYELTSGGSAEERLVHVDERSAAWSAILRFTSVTWTGSDFLLLQRHVRDASSYPGPGTGAWNVDPTGTIALPAFAAIPDWSISDWSSQHLPYGAYAIAQEDALLIFSSEVSTRPEEGLVRRLRVHRFELESRRRTTSR